MDDVAHRLGFWAGLAASGVVLASAPLVLVLSRPWTNMDDYTAHFSDIRLILFSLWMLLSWLLIVVFTTLVETASAGRRVYAQLAAAFTIPYAALVTFNYGLMLTFVRNRVRAGNTEGIDLWIVENPESPLFPLDLLAYFLLGTATFFAAFLFVGSRLATTTRVLLFIHAAMGVGGLLAAVFVSFDGESGANAGAFLLAAWAIELGATLILMALLLRRPAATTIPAVPNS